MKVFIVFISLDHKPEFIWGIYKSAITASAEIEKIYAGCRTIGAIGKARIEDHIIEDGG